MIRVLFICHGNICRSPMAQMIMQNIVNKKRLSDKFLIESMACSREEIGNGIYPPARACLIKHNIPLIEHYASCFKASDYDNYDYIICMDKSNIRRLNSICEDYNSKYKMLLDYTNQKGEVSDPWYTGDFETCFSDIYYGIDGFLDYLDENKLI